MGKLAPYPPPFAQLPIDTTQRGSGIWSYTFLRAGAILFVKVPATIITSDWRGEALQNGRTQFKSYQESIIKIN
jgi:hypothetical protein